jgi:ABC-type multidrug transport system ATPase subunit
MTVRLSGVGKRYGRSAPWVLRDADLALEPGALVRIAGTNGSGKSTLLKLVCGTEPASAGRVAVDGSRAYVPERFPPALPFDAVGYLRRVGRVHGLSRAAADERAESWLDRFGIADRAGTPLSRLSKGTCQKVAVAQALMAEADVLLLDEAWTGLDQAARTVLDEAAADRAGKGGTVLFVDHDPHRLAGLTTAAYRVDGGVLTRVEGEAAGGAAGGAASAAVPGPELTELTEFTELPEVTELMAVRLTVAELPDHLPGAPLRAPQPDGSLLLRVPAQYSDALLRRLLAADAHILRVQPEEAR